jgi:predicted ATPase
MKEDMHVYRKIIKPFDKDSEKDEWIMNIDYIRLFFKNIVSGESEEELEEDIKTVSENVVTKCEELLNISENFIKLKYVKKQLAKLIEKRCRDLACGKITVKARYQYIGICPISYMNFAMTRTQGEYGLQTGQFYNYDVPDGETRTIARNPLCAYSEIHNVRFVKKDLLDKYLSHCKEIIYLISRAIF